MMKRLIIVFLLGFSSGLPLSLLGSTLQAWFSFSNQSILVTGFLSLLGLPYAYKFIWGPFTDHYSLTRLGKRRSWLILTQFLLLMGFNSFAWLSPEQNTQQIVLLAIFLAIISATQDMVIDAQRIEYLPKNEHGLGASLAVLGYRIGLLVSGGLALIMASHWGFQKTYQFMGALMGVGILTTLLSQEPQHPSTQAIGKASLLMPLKTLIQRPDIYLLLGFIFFYKMGEAFTATTSGIVMPFLIQGLGFDLETIGYVSKILGVGAIIIGGLIAGIVLLKSSIEKALLCFGLIQVCTNFIFILLALVGHNLPLLCVAVMSDSLATGMGSTALVAFLMGQVDARYTATQMAILVAFSTLPRIFSGPVAAMLQLHVGWVGLYIIGFGVSFLFIPFWVLMKRSQND